MRIQPTPSLFRHRSSATALACALALAGMLPLSGQAASVSYALSFSDSASGATGSGSFVWDTETEIMSALTWTIAGNTGGVLDSALAATYHSWDPLAATNGELFFNFLTAPQAYLIAQNGQLESSSGLMPSDVVGDYFGFVAFGAKNTSAAGTYRFLDKNWNLASEGYVTAAMVPEPETYALMLAGIGLVGFAARRKHARS